MPTNEIEAVLSSIEDEINILVAENRRLKAERDVAVRALEHYAAHNSWRLSNDRIGDYDLYVGDDNDETVTHGFEVAAAAIRLAMEGE